MTAARMRSGTAAAQRASDDATLFDKMPIGLAETLTRPACFVGKTASPRAGIHPIGGDT